MTEADKFFEETVMKAEEPVLAQVSSSHSFSGSDMESPEDIVCFDDEYADEAPLFGPKTKSVAIMRLRKAEKQFSEGDWHSLKDAMSIIRNSIRK